MILPLFFFSVVISQNLIIILWWIVFMIKLCSSTIYCFSFLATAPGGLPPCFNPPPPPPPIEDIPHQTTVPQRVNRCMGPSYRGTYSDAEMCHCRGHYVDSNTALLHNHHNVRGHYSDNENPYHRGHSCSDSEHYHQVRQCVYSGEESDFEPHYLEQTASGNVFIPGLFNFVSCSTEKRDHEYQYS